jgi:predicted nuclease with TOPRIM domain
MIDETKVEYLNGKFKDMQGEINKAIEATGLNSLNRDRYQGILNDMNTSLTMGDYVEALDIWEDYDEDDREDLINGIINASNEEYTELENLRDIEAQLISLEQDIELLQSEYDQLDNTYVALANTYNKVNQELETVKGNLSTAITAVFLTAIVFFFLGRRGAKKEVEVENA